MALVVLIYLHTRDNSWIGKRPESVYDKWNISVVICYTNPTKNGREKSLTIPKGNQNPHIEEEQTTQWPKEKVQMDKQRSTKHTLKTKDRVTRATPKSGGELMCCGNVSSSCSISGTHRVNLFTNPEISHEWGKDRAVFFSVEYIRSNRSTFNIPILNHLYISLSAILLHSLV